MGDEGAVDLEQWMTTSLSSSADFVVAQFLARSKTQPLSLQAHFLSSFVHPTCTAHC